MNYIAKVNIMPLKALLDPQGKAVENSAKKIGFTDIDRVRIGKHIEVKISAKDKKSAEKTAKELCEKILINPIIESYELTVEKEEL